MDHEDLWAKLPVGVASLNLQGKVLAVNPKGEAIFQLKAASIVGKNLNQLFSKSEKKKLSRLIAQHRLGENFFAVFKRTTKDGWPQFIETNLAVLASSNQIFAFFQDVSNRISIKREHRRTIDELRQSEERYRLMIEGVEEYANFLLDSNGYVISWNNGAQRLNGYSAEEIIGQHFSIFHTTEDIKQGLSEQALKNAKENGRVETGGWRVRKDGSTFWAQVVLMALRDHDGNLRGFAKIVHDTTEKKRLDQQKDDFLAIASHELKTPITTIKAFNQLLQKKALEKKDQESYHYLSKTAAQLDRLTNLVSDLLDVSKVQANKLVLHKEQFKFDELVEEVVEDLQGTIDNHVLKVSSKTGKKILADKDRISQVLINLIVNAVKYSPNASKVAIRLSSGKTYVKVSVQDFGVGISQENVARVFDRFFRGSGSKKETFPGLGLGLYISFEIIKQHQGKIWVKSIEGKGSTFYFSLPIKVK